MKDHEVVIMFRKPSTTSKSPKVDYYAIVLYILKDVSSDLLEYSKHRHFGKEKWNKKRGRT